MEDSGAFMAWRWFSPAFRAIIGSFGFRGIHACLISIAGIVAFFNGKAQGESGFRKPFAQ